MSIVLASGGLAPWGQAAAIILALYLFISIIVGLGLAAALMFGFAWIREKAELIKKLRPLIIQLNQATQAAKQGDPLPREVADNKIMSAVVQVPKVAATLPARANSIEQKVEQGSGRVANAVIEFHARTAMVKGMAKAFFLPGLTKSRPAPIERVIERKQDEMVTPEKYAEEGPLEQEIVITQSFR